jgi:single-stranded-DNA-specific exonuclease
MGEGKHARFSLHSGAHRALGVAFGRPTLGVGEEDLVDAAVRLEVNRWNGAVEPRVVLSELYPREAGNGSPAAEDWWRRFEVELARVPGEWPAVEPPAGMEHERRVLTSANAPAAVVGELASCGESVLALCADAALRGGMSCEGSRLADYPELERSPELPAEFTHVVLVDPPPFADLERLASRSAAPDGYLHRAWGEAEWRFALGALGEQLAQRAALIATFRDLREAGEVSGEKLRKALLGDGPHPRSAETAARCFRVLAELELVRGAPAGGDGEVGVVSSEGTDLERSASFRAYSARYQEAQQFLKERKQP